MKSLDLASHFGAQLGVEIGERLVEQEQVRIANDRAAHRDALTLPSGKLPRPALEQWLDLKELCDAIDKAACSAFGTLRTCSPKVEIVPHAHVG